MAAPKQYASMFSFDDSMRRSTSTEPLFSPNTTAFTTPPTSEDGSRFSKNSFPNIHSKLLPLPKLPQSQREPEPHPIKHLLDWMQMDAPPERSEDFFEMCPHDWQGGGGDCQGGLGCCTLENPKDRCHWERTKKVVRFDRPVPRKEGLNKAEEKQYQKEFRAFQKRKAGTWTPPRRSDNVDIPVRQQRWADPE